MRYFKLNLYTQFFYSGTAPPVVAYVRIIPTVNIPARANTGCLWPKLLRPSEYYVIRYCHNTAQ